MDAALAPDTNGSIGPLTGARMSAAAKRRCAGGAERERLRSISNGKPPISMGEKNPRAKLTDLQVRELREKAAAGLVQSDLAVSYGITPASVSQLVLGRSRRGAGGPVRESPPPHVLTDEQVAEIRRLYGDGLGVSAIARRFDVHRSHISANIPGH